MKWELKLCIIVIVIGAPFIYLIPKWLYEDFMLINREGIETVGTVTYKSAGSNGADFYIHFDFLYNGVSHRSIMGTFVSPRNYEDAVIGRKYKVKYLPKSPKKARIYIDEPIDNEDVNIEKEQELILETYK